MELALPGSVWPRPGLAWSGLVLLGLAWSSLLCLGPAWSSLVLSCSSLVLLGPPGPAWSGLGGLVHLGVAWCSMMRLKPAWSNLGRVGTALFRPASAWSGSVWPGPAAWSGLLCSGPAWSRMVGPAAAWFSLASPGAACFGLVCLSSILAR